MGRVRIAVSACLLGENVRYDGGHKYDPYVAEELAAHCELVSLCPELEAGMGVPREPVHLAGDPAAPRMVGNLSGEDWTARVGALAGERVAQLDAMRVAGCVLKSRSPSCGIDGVDVAAEDGRLEPIGRGLLAAQLRRQLPWLPVAQERDLRDVGRREHFVVRVFARHRLDDLLADASRVHVARLRRDCRHLFRVCVDAGGAHLDEAQRLHQASGSGGGR